MNSSGLLVFSINCAILVISNGWNYAIPTNNAPNERFFISGSCMVASKSTLLLRIRISTKGTRSHWEREVRKIWMLRNTETHGQCQISKNGLPLVGERNEWACVAQRTSTIQIMYLNRIENFRFGTHAHSHRRQVMRWSGASGSHCARDNTKRTNRRSRRKTRTHINKYFENGLSRCPPLFQLSSSSSSSETERHPLSLSRSRCLLLHLSLIACQCFIKSTISGTLWENQMIWQSIHGMNKSNHIHEKHVDGAKRNRFSSFVWRRQQRKVHLKLNENEKQIIKSIRHCETLASCDWRVLYKYTEYMTPDGIQWEWRSSVVNLTQIGRQLWYSSSPSFTRSFLASAHWFPTDRNTEFICVASHPQFDVLNALARQRKIKKKKNARNW